MTEARDQRQAPTSPYERDLDPDSARPTHSSSTGRSPAGENISSTEVEDALYRHPAALEAAVVARPDQKRGESPCAFVTLRDDAGEVSEDDIIAFCREHMARFNVPRTVVCTTLATTSTGEIQRFVLRGRAEKP